MFREYIQIQKQCYKDNYNFQVEKMKKTCGKLLLIKEPNNLHFFAYKNYCPVLFHGEYEVIRYLTKYEVIPNINKYGKEFKYEYLNSFYSIILNEKLLNKYDKISFLANKLMVKNIGQKIIFIEKYGEIIGKKIIRDSKYFPKYFKNTIEDWIPVWHGTKFDALASIMEYGLKLPGSKLPNGIEIKPLDNHIDRNVTVDNIKDWAKGIFTSHSIFYSSHPAYAEVIKSHDKEWIVLIESRVKNGRYQTHGSTVGSYNFIEGEPKDLEYRIQDESDIIVVSVLFANKKYLNQIKKYNEAAVFVSPDEEIISKDIEIENNYYCPKKSNRDFSELMEIENNYNCSKKSYKDLSEYTEKKNYYYNPNYTYRDSLNMSLRHKKNEFLEEQKIEKEENRYHPNIKLGRKNSKINGEYVSINKILYKLVFIENEDTYFESKILGYDSCYQEILKEWLKRPNPYLGENAFNNISLLYRGSRDGFEARKFHSKCDMKGRTLVIIKSKDGYIFGGYSTISWESTKWNGKCGKDNNARRQGYGFEFVFTLKNPHSIPPSKYNMKKDWLDHSICCDINLGPIFGCNDIRIENNCNTNNNSFSYYDFNPGEYSFNDTTGKKRLLFTGSSTYKVEEIEVFKIQHKSHKYPEEEFDDYDFSNR